MRRAGVEACVALGFLALALLGGPWLVASGLAWGLSVAARMAGPRLRGTPGLLVLVVGAVVLATGVAFGLMSLESAVVGGLVLLQLQRRLTRRGPVDDRVTVAVAGLMLVVAAGRTAELGFLPIAFTWALALPVALLPEGRRTSPGAAHLLAGGAVHLVASALFFVLLPRAGGGVDAPSSGQKLVGFAPDVELGVLGALLDDPAIVFRAQVEGTLPERIYWRGIALDGFDGRRWYSSTPPVPTATDAGGGGVRVRVVPEGPSDGVLFAPGSVLHVEAGEVRGDPQGGWFVPPERSSAPYVVEVLPHGAGEAWFSEASNRLDPWLSLPAQDARISELASSVAGQGAASARARRVRSWLASEVTYTRSGGDHGDDPLTSFLLDRREGHCEYVAAGLTVLLRSEGIPARVVNGFLGGEVDPLTGELVVRRLHAHSWTEALLDGRWVLLDATPLQAPVDVATGQQLAESMGALWQRTVVAYDRDDQRGSLARLLASLQAASTRPLLTVGGLGLAVLTAFALGVGLLRVWRRRLPGAGRSARTGLSGPLQRAEAALRRAGLSPPPAAPPVELARWLRGRVPDDVAEAFEALAWLHYDVVFGGVPPQQVRFKARELAERMVQELDPAAPDADPAR